MHTEQHQRWRSGASLPTVKDIRTISDRLQVPFGYFFLSQPIDDTPPVCAHRTIGSRDIDRKPSRDLVDTVYAMSALQDWARQDRLITMRNLSISWGLLLSMLTVPV